MRKLITIAYCFFLCASGLAQTETSKEFIKLSLEELMDIKVISSTGTEQRINEAPSVMIVITKEQIEERGYEQLDDALRDMPGIDFVHASQDYTYRTFRGMFGDENKRILIMLDGTVLNNLIGATDLGSPSFFSLHNIERIEIIWGPGSALYGANAFSGVINMISKKGADINGLNYQHAHGSFNTSFDKVAMGVNKSNFDVMFAGSLYNSDGPVYKNMHPNYSNSYMHNSWGLNGAIEHQIKKFKTKIGFTGFEKSMGIGTLATSPTVLYGLPPIYQNKGTAGGLCADIGTEKPSLYNSYYRLTYLQNQFTPNEKFNLLTQIQYIESGLSEKSYAYSASASMARKVLLAHYSNRVLGEVRASYLLSDHHHLFAGIILTNDDLEKGFRGTNPDPRIDTIDHIPLTNRHATFQPRKSILQSNAGAYVQYILNTNLFHKTNIILGTRYDMNNIYGETFNPRVGIIIQPVEKLTFKLLFGSAFRAPTTFELYSELPGTRIPNPDLKPEKVNTIDIAVNYIPTKSLLVRLAVFQNDLTDIIVQDVPIGQGLAQNQNKGSASTYGAELKMDYIPVKTISAFLNLTYLNAEGNNGTKGFTMPDVAKYKGNAGITFHIADLLNISIVENAVGPRSVHMSNPLGEVKGYFLTGLVISTQKLFNNQVSASFKLQNVFNQTWLDPGIKAIGGVFGTVHEQPGVNGLFKISVAIK